MSRTLNSVSIHTSRKQEFTDAVVKIVAGMCANPCLKEHWPTSEEAADYAINAATNIFEKVDDVFREKETEEARNSGLIIGNTGLTDANDKFICDGDIFVYCDDDKTLIIPDDLVENYDEKYSKTISLHPVFWSEELHDYASDVFTDEDRLWTYSLDKVVVVTNKTEHPELYNH